MILEGVDPGDNQAFVNKMKVEERTVQIKLCKVCEEIINTTTSGELCDDCKEVFRKLRK